MSPRGELQVSSGAADAGRPRSPGLPLRHLPAAGRGGAHLRRLHRLLPVRCSAAGKPTRLLNTRFARVFMSLEETEDEKSFLSDTDWFLVNSLALPWPKFHMTLLIQTVEASHQKVRLCTV